MKIKQTLIITLLSICNSSILTYKNGYVNFKIENNQIYKNDEIFSTYEIAIPGVLEFQISPDENYLALKIDHPEEPELWTVCQLLENTCKFFLEQRYKNFSNFRFLKNIRSDAKDDTSVFAFDSSITDTKANKKPHFNSKAVTICRSDFTCSSAWISHNGISRKSISSNTGLTAISNENKEIYVFKNGESAKTKMFDGSEFEIVNIDTMGELKPFELIDFHWKVSKNQDDEDPEEYDSMIISTWKSKKKFVKLAHQVWFEENDYVIWPLVLEKKGYSTEEGGDFEHEENKDLSEKDEL